MAAMTLGVLVEVVGGRLGGVRTTRSEHDLRVRLADVDDVDTVGAGLPQVGVHMDLFCKMLTTVLLRKSVCQRLTWRFLDPRCAWAARSISISWLVALITFGRLAGMLTVVCPGRIEHFVVVRGVPWGKLGVEAA